MTSVSFISLSHSLPIKLYFSTTKYFQIIYLICSSIVSKSYLAPTVVIIRYGTSRLNKIFGSYFLVFGKCGVTPHRLYSGSLTLSIDFTVKSIANAKTYLYTLIHNQLSNQL